MKINFWKKEKFWQWAIIIVLLVILFFSMFFEKRESTISISINERDLIDTNMTPYIIILNKQDIKNEVFNDMLNYLKIHDTVEYKKIVGKLESKFDKP